MDVGRPPLTFEDLPLIFKYGRIPIHLQMNLHSRASVPTLGVEFTRLFNIPTLLWKNMMEPQLKLFIIEMLIDFYSFVWLNTF